MSFDRLSNTLIELIGIPSTSGHEEQVRHYLEQHLATLGLLTHVDEAGNLIATFSKNSIGGGTLLLNAHMDRVPPGLGHRPILRDGTLYSDGTTNLGADDAAGIVIILEVLRRVVEQKVPHPPLLIVFTVQEEAGMCGAGGFNSTRWPATHGIVFDNAFDAGVVVSQGAAYKAFDVTITGRTGHPGKDLSPTVNALEIFRRAQYPFGVLANDQTRISIGRIHGGSARNAVPANLTLEGELRSFESPERIRRYEQDIQHAFEQTAQHFGGQATVTFKTHTDGYVIDEHETLLNTYKAVLEQRGEKLHLQPTFIGSDTSGFRPKIKAFTLSTGVMKEHSTEEYVALAPLEQVVQDTLQVLRNVL
ncbi:MAG: M20/M25/M40 family metallo-hydrolase [Ktedonobacteraceae bacterium]